MAEQPDEGDEISNPETEISYPKSPQKPTCSNESSGSSHISVSHHASVLVESVDTESRSSDKKSLEDSLNCTVRDDIKKKIENILTEVQLWSDTEKLLLYLKLPGSKHRDKKQDENDLHTMPLSTTRAEQTQAFHWIRCHLEECENSSTLPKHEVYDEYKAHCESVNAVRVLSAPDFGKIIKCVFPNVKARRLGTRGNSKYCYSGIQKKRIVKSPQLPNLMAPAPGDKNLANGGSSGSTGDKIGDDQTLVAACILVCEWANKLLGRVFNTLTELARFLVGGSYVSSKSMAAFVVMSSNEASGSCNKLTLNSLKFSEDQALMTQKRKQTQQHLQRKIQQRQQHKQQQQHQLNLLLHPSTPTGKQFTPILPQTQKTLHVTQVSGLRIQHKPQQLQLSPKPNLVTSAQSPPTPCTPVHYNQTSQRTLGHLPTSTTLSPVTQSLTSPNMHSSSPYHTNSPKRSAPCTPRSGTITPSPAGSTPRHTPNGEATRFVFTPITNGTPDSKTTGTGGEASPPLLKRPTATHPGQMISNEWSNNSHKSGTCLPTTPVKENPVSPCKQPRMVLTNPPRTPNKQNSFSHPLVSPRMAKRTGLSKTTTVALNSQASSQVRVPISPRGSQNSLSLTRHHVPTQLSVPSSCSVTIQADQSVSQMITQGRSHQPPNFLSFDYSNNLPNDCRFNQAITLPSSQEASVQQNFLNHIPTDQELEAICHQLRHTVPTAVQGNRCHSVPPLPQNVLPRANSVMQSLTPQTNNRQQLMTQRLVNISGHEDGLKQLRNRVLHGDTNNNSSNGGAGASQTNTVYAAKRNLMSELEGVTATPAAWTPSTSGFQQNKMPPQDLPEMQSDPLSSMSLEEIAMEAAGSNLDMLVDCTAEALFADSNPFGNAWNVSQPLTMDSCM